MKTITDRNSDVKIVRTKNCESNQPIIVQKRTTFLVDDVTRLLQLAVELHVHVTLGVEQVVELADLLLLLLHLDL